MNKNPPPKTDPAIFTRAELQSRFADVGYIADRELAMALRLMQLLHRPLLLEGDAGVGKTEVAKAMALILKAPLIRLQCYEGLDVNSAVYEWNYQRQLLAIKIWENEDITAAEKERHVFTEEFLLRRPLLQAISMDTPPVLLIDEIDRADEEFEAYLLELLSDFQISIPELGTIKARAMPFVVITSNATRELSDALRRRCLYHFVDYPSEAKELAIVLARLPGIAEALAGQIVRFIQGLRRMDLRKKPGVAETLDWAAALMGMQLGDLGQDLEAVHESLLCVLKTKEDHDLVSRAAVERLVSRAG